MGRTLVLIFGVVSYLAFFATFLYLIGFMMGIVVPIDINTLIHDGKPRLDRIADSKSQAIMINIALMLIFVVQHTIMARGGFKDKLTTIIPRAAERSVFVLLASISLIVIMWQWRPIVAPLADDLWKIEGGAGYYILQGVALLGWGLVLLSSFLINHFSLFGLQQPYEYFKGREFKPPAFRMPLLYMFVRHPLMLGIIIAFWSTPHMSQGRLLFAIFMTGYILVGIRFEEKDLAAHLGDDYIEYQKKVSMIIPMPPKS